MEGFDWYGQMFDTEFPLRGADDIFRPFIILVLPMKDAKETIIRWFGTNTDIIKRERNEQQLFNTNELLEALLKVLPVGISFSNDPTCQMIIENPLLLAQFDGSLEDNISASAQEENVPGREVRFFLDGMQISDIELPLHRAIAEP